MEKREKIITGKEIADKYRFEEVKNLEKDELLKVYKDLYKLCLDKMIALDVSETKIERLNIELKGKNGTRKIKYEDYDPEWKGIEKVIYILRENNKVMLTSEIQKELLTVEPSLNQKWDKPYTATIKYISRGVKFGRIIQYSKNGNYGYTYALPEWFDENGSLIKRYCI